MAGEAPGPHGPSLTAASRLGVISTQAGAYRGSAEPRDRSSCRNNYLLGCVVTSESSDSILTFDKETPI
jgi:hypothetical protein